MTLQSFEKNRLSRRTFLKKCTGTIVFAMGASCYVPGVVRSGESESKIPLSDGYLVVDVEKCQGCISCMLACSLVHEGVHNPSLSRIQILQNSFEKFPQDLAIEPCRQCEIPACVTACPENALTANAEFGHVRMVDREKCTGCGTCFEACPYTPARLSVAEDNAFNQALKSRKCDLCAHAPHHWDEKGGGPDGQQACVAVCPLGAIAFIRKLPAQQGISGYQVDLRGKNWTKLGYGSP